MFPLSQPESEAKKSYIEEELAKGLIHPSTSSTSTGFFFVKKKVGGLHLCIEDRGLNNITVKFHYPLPLVPAPETLHRSTNWSPWTPSPTVLCQGRIISTGVSHYLDYISSVLPTFLLKFCPAYIAERSFPVCFPFCHHGLLPDFGLFAARLFNSFALALGPVLCLSQINPDLFAWIFFVRLPTVGGWLQSHGS